MNTRQIRKQNLERLRDRYKERCKRERKRYKLKDFAALYGIEPRTCSQILNGYVGLGEDLARRIEAAARPKLPYGWMDVPHSATEPVNKDELDFQEAFLTVYRAHPESARKLLIKMVKDLLSKGDE